MCAIFGAVLKPTSDYTSADILNYIARESIQRGRDGYGLAAIHFFRGSPTELYQEKFPGRTYSLNNLKVSVDSLLSLNRSHLVVGNMRAEPTTEYVEVKCPADQQPYSLGDWTVVHNGTIANDKELRTDEYDTDIDSAAIVEVLNKLTTNTEREFGVFCEMVARLKGSYAILAMNRNSETMYVAANYRPIWWIQTEHGVYFASSRDFFPKGYVPQMLDPYTVAAFTHRGIVSQLPTRKEPLNKRALVVCSGGLDSVVSAAWAKNQMGLDVQLIHFRYGSRAEGPEVLAIQDVADALCVPLRIMELPVYSKSDSPLLDENSKVAGGEAGAEFAHEWVPARNLLLLSVATAYAEAQGCHYLVLGNNMEEAGAYPDNEPEFIAKFNDMLPFAIGDGKRLQVIMPVGNMMKHEIVEMGKKCNAPMHLTWSCYKALTTESGKYIHCGSCGPCFMRRTAFQINKYSEVIDYAI